MSRKDTTQRLTELLQKHINPYNDPRIYTAREVTFDYSTEHPIRVDFMVFKPVNQTIGGIEKGNFYCYEIKSCKEDYNSGHGLNFIGDFNYLVIPYDLYDEIKNSVPYYVGVYAESKGYLSCVKKAKQKSRQRSVSEMLLMMFRSSNRELIKVEKTKRKDSYIAEEFPIEPPKGMNDYKCGECGKYSVASHKPEFCSHCGAKYIERKTNDKTIV